MKRASLIAVVVLLVACGNKKSAPTGEQPVGSAVAAGSGSAESTDRTTTFWRWFTDHAAELRADKDLRHTMDLISDELEKTHKGVFAEIGADGANRTLVLSVDGKKELFPLVHELYAARPTVAGWTVVAFRQRATAEGTIEMEGKKVDPKALKFVATKEGDKLAITVFVPGFTSTDDMGSVLFIVLDHTIGEYDMETRIGGIDFASIDKAPASAQPLPELPPLIDKTFPPH